MPSSLLTLSAVELARSIREGTVSPVAVVDACLSRIAARDPEVNAFITVREDAARERAKEAERELRADGPVGPLHGVPVAVKDLLNVAGVRTTFGSSLFTDHTADKDDIAVKRLREAGAIIIGKTNTPEFGRKTNTTNTIIGATGNPWDVSLTAGGSSGGSAAAVADCMVPVALGTDAAGSIRIPAAACGIVGVMPDFGRVPSGPDRADAFVNMHPYSYVGPLTRTVEDAALVLDVLSGPSSRDPFSLPARTSPYVDSVIESTDPSFRVAYSEDLGICRVDDAISRLVSSTLADVEKESVSIDARDPSFDSDYDTIHDALVVLLQDRYRGLYDTMKNEFGVDLLENRDVVTPAVVSRIEKSLSLTAIDVRRAEQVRTRAFDAVQALFDEYDVLVSPTIGAVPFDKEQENPVINGEFVEPNHGWILTWPFNLTGNPVVSVPVGHVEDVPVGVQIVGPRLADQEVVSFAAMFEREQPWAEWYSSS